MLEASLQFPVAPLFVPADRPERFAKAESSGADAVIIDLEDSVAPQHKDGARRLAAGATALHGPVIVRINAQGTPWHQADVDFMQRHLAFGVMIPKAENPASISRLLASLGPRLTVALIESALGVQTAAAIAAVPGVSQLAFGPADLCRDLGCQPASRTLVFARSALVIASRAASIAPPLDGPTFEIKAPELVVSAAADAKDLGFGGKLCIHPSQAPLVQMAFAPTEAEVAWALKVVEAQRSQGVVLLEGVMVDKPVVEAAINTLKRAGAVVL